MANKAISELPQAQNVNNQDLFVLEQSGIAKKLTAETFITEQGIIDALAEALDGHGGISSVTLSSVSGRIRTYLITFTDETTTTFQVYDGTSIDRIVKTSTAGLTDTYTVFMNDGSTTFFTVTNGADGSVSEAMLNDALKDKAPAVTETTESSAIANFTDGADDMVMHNIVAKINPVQSGSGDPSPSNIRPISGWTGCTVYHSGADMSNPETISISWQSEAGTVYGGTIDVATGLLTVDAMLEVFDELPSGNDGIQSQIDYCLPTTNIGTVGDYTRISFGIRGDIQRSDYNLVSSSYSFKMCNMLKHYFSYADESSHWYRNTTLYAYFPSSLVGTTITSVINYLKSIKDTNPLSFWLPLTHPQTYQLTGQQLATLLGTNNVQASTGKVSVTYPADTKMYIQNLTQPTEDDMTANQAITSGKYFMIGNSLYLALANIASGAQITIGTNAQRVSLADALNTISS